MKKYILILIILLSLMLLFKTRNDRILYSWSMDYIEDSDYVKLDKIIKKLNINVIYQDFSSEYLNNIDNTFLNRFNKIKIYHLAGDPSWGLENGSKFIIEEINKVVFYNNNVTNKIKGIVLDIEPYASEKFEDADFSVADFSIYIEQIEKSYYYAKENQLEFILVIPYWFDDVDKNLFEQLITYTDEISVMNYNIDKTVKNISYEIEMCKKYNKKINTIYEINFDKEGYFLNFDDIKNDYSKIKTQYNKLNIAYHHYEAIKID